MRKAIFDSQRTGFSRCGGNPYTGCLKDACYESDPLRSPNSFLRIYSGAGLPGSDLESPKSYELNILGFLHSRVDTIDH
jgi:hypothetical protein